MTTTNIKVGIDNVLLSRIDNKVLESFPKRILSDNEMQEFNSASNKVNYLASRFAAKEAYIKASKNIKVSLKDIETLNDEIGAPHIYYQNKECGSISITHDYICTVIVILN